MTRRMQSLLERWYGDKDVVTFFLDVLKLTGLLPARSSAPREKWTTLRRGWVHIELWFLTAILIVLSPMTIYHSWDVDLMITSEIAGFMFAVGVIIVSVGSFLYLDERFEKMFDALEAMKTLGSLHQSQPKEVIEAGKKLSLTALIYYFILSFVLISTTVLGIPIYCLRRREFVIRFWFPYDYKASPYFELTITVLLIIFIYGLNAINFVNSLLLLIFAQTASQLTLLNHNIAMISNVASTCKTKLGLGSKSPEKEHEVIPEKLSTNNPHWAVDNAHVVVNIVVAEKKCSNNISSLGMVRKCTSTTDKVVHVKETRFLQCIKHHQAITSFIPEIQATFGPIIFSQFICNICPVIVAIIIILESEVVDEKTYFIFALIATSMVQQGCLSYLAENVITEGENVRDSVYGCDWLRGSDSFKRSLRIMMSRSNQLLVVKPAGIPLTLESFFGVIRIAFNFYKSLSAMLDSTLEIQP